MIKHERDNMNNDKDMDEEMEESTEEVYEYDE
jgi:hypothetical protein